MLWNGLNALNLGSASLLSHIRTPLYRNAYAWMFSTGISSGLGIVYWLLAARLYVPEVVGVNVALVSAMIFLSGVAQLNLMSAMIRYLPTAGTATWRLVGGAYGVSVGVSALLGAAVLLFLQAWDNYQFIQLDDGLGLWFVLSMMAWSIFALQDSVLTGLRDAVWVPIENTIYAVVKIGLLVLFAQTMPQYGIFLAWILPVFVMIIPINWLIFRRLIPAHIAGAANMTTVDGRVDDRADDRVDVETIALAQIAKYIAGNYIGSLFTLASNRLLPVLVTWRAGGTAGAYFYMAWAIAHALKLITTQMTMSLTVEGAYDRARLHLYGKRFLKNLTVIFVPAVAVTVVAAPYVLRLSGSDYAVAGTRVLQLMAISVIPSMITLLYLGMARVQDNIRGIIAAQGAISILLLGLSYLLLPQHGIMGVGIALLVSESTVAIILLITKLLPIWRQ